MSEILKPFKKRAKEYSARVLKQYLINFYIKQLSCISLFRAAMSLL